MDMRKIATRNAEVDRFGAGGEEQRAEAQPAAVHEPDFSRLGIDRDRAGAELQPDRLPFIGWESLPGRTRRTAWPLDPDDAVGLNQVARGQPGDWCAFRRSSCRTAGGVKERGRGRGIKGTEPSKVFSLRGAEALVSVCLSSFRACRCSPALPTSIME